MRSTRKATALLLFAAIVAFGAFAIALWSQIELGIKPCPWCVLQRLIILVAGALALLGALFGAKPVRLLLAGLTDLAAMAGLAAAIWQQAVAAKSASCALTVADRIMMATGLDERFPALFMATAACDEASVPMFGIPHPMWSAAAFVLISIASAMALAATARR